MTAASSPLLALYLSAAHEYDLGAVRAAGLDAVIFDLEASVPADKRLEARARLLRWFAEPPLAATVLVRVNDLGTEPGAHDLAAVADETGVNALLLPGFDGEAVLPAPFDARPLWLMIESGAGLAWIESQAPTPAGTSAVVIGYKDLAKDQGLAFDPAETALHELGCRILAAAHRRGLRCFDGVWLGAAPVVSVAAQRSLEGGFDGLTVYHPAHVPLVRQVFAEAGRAAEVRHAL